MDNIGFLVIGVIVFISGLLTVICGVGYLKKTYFFEDLIEETLKNIANDEEMQKNLFIIGGVLGNGVKGGIGLPSSKGKTSLKGIAMDLLGQFLQNTVNNPSPSLQPLPYPNSQDSLTQKRTDKW